MQDFQKIGTAYSELLQSNPFYNVADEMMGLIFDYWMQIAIKMYYWPAFVAGTADDVVSLFDPKTYSICKL